MEKDARRDATRERDRRARSHWDEGDDASEASEGWMRPVAGDAAPADPPPTTEHDDLLAQLSQFRVHFNERTLDTGEHRREVHCDFEPPR